MPRRTDDFSAAVVRCLRDRVNGACSNPGCHRATVGPSRTQHDRSAISGEAAHIRAASPGGSRYDETQTTEERRSIENAIWLCGGCADLIDKNEGADYPVEVLLKWKRQAEEKAARAQAAPAGTIEAPWSGRFSAISYINVPRLAMWSAGAGVHLDFSDLRAVSCLHDLGWDLNRVLLQVEDALSEVTIAAIPIDAVREIEDDFTGATLSFDHQFFTKNGPEIPRGRKATLVPTDWKKAPHIHCKIGPWRVVAVYDPKWVTTTTAYVEFRGGNRRFAGVGIVKEVNRADHLVLVSPLVIGIPKPDFDIFDF